MGREIYRSHPAAPELALDLVLSVERLPDEVFEIHIWQPSRPYERFTGHRGVGFNSKRMANAQANYNR